MQETSHPQAAAIGISTSDRSKTTSARFSQTSHCVFQEVKGFAAHDPSGALQHGHIPGLLAHIRSAIGSSVWLGKPVGRST